jgi:RimJ/RimL family protein N-acetyltransferase
VLREWRDDDRAAYAALNADPVVMEHFPAPLSREQSDAHIAEITRRFDLGEPSLWALEVVETGEFIGFTGLLAPSFEAAFTPCVEVGWRLAASAWGHGYATEAANAAVAHGFTEHDLDEIVSFTTTTNLPSQRVMRRLGMTHDPADDFDHPNVDRSSILCRHVLFRLSRSTWKDR